MMTDKHLYWGNGHLFYVKLNKDMTSYRRKSYRSTTICRSFRRIKTSGKSEEVLQKQEKFEDVYVEGPWFYKRNNLYYLMYAGMTNRTECLSYSTSNSPIELWKYQGKIMTDQPTNSFTNHGGIIDYKKENLIYFTTRVYYQKVEVMDALRLLKNSNIMRMEASRKLQ